MQKYIIQKGDYYMQKFIRILVIIATVLVGISFSLLFISILFQLPIAKYYNYPNEAIGLLPQIPVAQILICFLRLVCVALLIVCCGNKKGGVWMEIILFVLMLTLLPLIDVSAPTIYNKMIVYLRGTYFIMANNISNSIASYCLIPANIGLIISYFACGMSIMFKHMNKKMDQAVLEAKIGIEEMNGLDS